MIDVASGTLLPGLIDAHVHTNAESLAQALRFGVTTVEMQGTNTAANRAHIALPPPAKDAESLGAYSAEQLDAEALMRVDAFHDIWDAGLIFFGVHLLLGSLAFRSGYAPRVLGVLLALAGLGYLVESFDAFLSAGCSAAVSVFTGVGELILMIWLLAKGRNIGSRLPIQAETAP